MANISDRFDALVCDMDGVLYRGDQVVPGAPQAVARMRETGMRVVFCTNNSRSTVAEYLDKLSGMGFEASRDELITSAIVTIEELRRRSFEGNSAYVVGGAGIDEALRSEGIDIIEGEEGATVDLVVVGWDRGFTWDKMRIAADAVRSGATFIATNADATFPAATGTWPGAGSILASIERASGRQAEVMGKPFDPMLRTLRERLSGTKEVAMIGDRADTDLAGARTLGWGTILVLSGVTSEAEAAALDPQPDLIVPSIADLR